MTDPKMTLVDWLDDLCVRFIVNLPNEELQSVERICFQIEEAQWFYEDFIRPLDPNSLPSMHLRKFSQLMFQHCPLFSAYSEELHQQAYEQFLAYKTRVPVRGAIMLNEDMTHAVLVKGWKKGAKWSFPRGKINKEETDLDCAVREVWEETGYDLRAADLVEPDKHMKKITVTMREQTMMLYVFRGVPMDTYFEPQTRKEISKIDWYKLTDLPTLRRKNQAQHQGAGQDLVKDNSFYMVAPFLGPLKQWIKQQHKLGKQRARNSAQMPPPPTAEAAEDDDLQPDLYETTADEAAPVEDAQPTNNFADLVAQLGRSQRPDVPLSELPDQPQIQQQSSDPAEALKRLLSVGMGMQSPPVEAPSMPAHSRPQSNPHPNPLLALFHQGNNQPGGPHMSLPRTPFDQVMSQPAQPSSPHGQHHPRPPQMGNMGPPPPFFPPHQGMPFRGPPQHFNGMPPPMPPQFMHQPPPQHQGQMPPQHQGQMSPQHRGQMFPPQLPNMQQAFDQRNPRSYQETGDSQFAGGNGRPAIPPASKLPAPNLNAHAMGLLNSFRTNDQSPAFPPSPQTTIPVPLQQSQQTTPKIEHPLPQHRPHGLVSPPFVPSPPPFQSSPIHTSFEPELPKPRSAHQDSLLSMFKPAQSLAISEPAELSALPTTPGYVSAQPAVHPSKLLVHPLRQPHQPQPGVLGFVGTLPKKARITSATVSGPVNAPDFDTMRKNTQPTSGNSRGPSPATQMPFMPQQILKRGQSNSALRNSANNSPRAQNVPSSNVAQASNNTQQTIFKPQILKRPQQQQQTQQTTTLSPIPKPTAQAQGLLDMFKSPSPQPTPLQPAVLPSQSPAPPTAHTQGLLNMFKGPSPQPAPAQSALPPSRSPVPPAASSSGTDRRESVPSDQKNALLSLFGNKPSPSPKPPMHSPIPPTRSPLPPTPKNTMSGVISPVSPLPTNGSMAATSPEGMANVSRISSMEVGTGATPSIVIPDPAPTSHPVDIGTEGGVGLGASASATEGKSPVDKTFLLGFLEDVARRGR